MQGFLNETARDLYDRFGDAISSLHIMFPSRRARLFFTDALAAIAERPLWQPHWITVDELMEEVSGLHSADRIRLIAELYKVYSRYHDEPFDKFYFWGDMLLADFDTIDKYMVDARMLFRNIADIRELEADMSYLTPEQLRIVSFWGCFADGEELSREKRRFLEMWRTLGDIYTQFREALAAQGIAYGGMLHRAAAEKLRDGTGSFAAERTYAIAGFNALSECEKQLFRSLEATGRALFYWDYDSYYRDRSEQEAGMFLRDNIRMFPPAGDISHDNMLATKRSMTVVAASSDAVQCKYPATILDTLARMAPGGELGKETAIVLTDEELLLPVLHSLPESVGRANVTMGYPLRRTLAYSFVERLIELQSRQRTRHGKPAFYHADVTGLLSHPYIADSDADTCRRLIADIADNRRIDVDAEMLSANELLASIFRPVAGRAELERYLADAVAAAARTPGQDDEADRRTEFLAVIAEEIAKTGNSLAGCGIDISTAVYTSLLRRHLQTLRIPFEGEPLEGVQIMGILETRNLDFKNVIILSMTDDNFPGAVSSRASFIPYNLRAAYALPTHEHHEGVYAYYFYRLIQRAENVWMLYRSHADEKSTGEPSRYIRQLGFESGLKIGRTEVGVDIVPAHDSRLEVAKEGRTLEKLGEFTGPARRMLSPTAFYRYVACPMRFYLASIARVNVDDELSDDIDSRIFGNILHASMQILYERIRGEHSPGDTLRALLKTDAPEQAVEQAIREMYLKDPDAGREDYTGNLTLVREIILRYIRSSVIPYDAAHDDFSVQGLEQQVEIDFPFESAGRSLSVRLAGTSDRIDSLDDGSLRVVDYKTGSMNTSFDSPEELFNGPFSSRHSHIIQTLLYSMMLSRSKGREVTPALYYVRRMHEETFSPLLNDRSGKQEIRYSDVAERFENAVRDTLAEMFDASIPFRMCEDTDTCRYCDYRAVCNRTTDQKQ
ncbi:MAG: PD-(D/E)XK nuclease family protein [Alistipes sp.]|nr:PD-(D/E)XK nuclease family protein [Alistipes sp.]